MKSEDLKLKPYDRRLLLLELNLIGYNRFYLKKITVS